MAMNYPVNPRVRAYGKARIDIAGRVKTTADWEKLWVRPSNTFPFVWGESWKQCVEYQVDDYAAEVGFFIDVLGFQVNAFDPGYAMFTSPQGDFYIAVVPTHDGNQSTPPGALRLQFMLADVLATTRELEKRGIAFDLPAQPIQPGSSHYMSSFRTPHGIQIELWGVIAPASGNQSAQLIQGDQVDDEEESLKHSEADEAEAAMVIAEDEPMEDEDDEDTLVFDEGEDEVEDDEDLDLLEYDDEDFDEDDGTFDLDDER